MYKRQAQVDFVRGEGAVLFDDEGNEYLDFLSGISVASVLSLIHISEPTRPY